MKISRNWLQTFFEHPLPDAVTLADALTFHAFEIDGIEMREAKPSSNESDAILDVKVTANRGHDCLSHRGIAKELSAILDLPLVPYPYGIKELALEPKTDALKVVVEDSRLCPRFTAAVIKGVNVGPSPEWLRTALESIGQKSINNIVDATNYAMFNIGQPLHAFDALKLAQGGDNKRLVVRLAKEDEPLTTLDNKMYALNKNCLVIADGVTGEALSIAGIKGGISSAVGNSTKNIILEAANWDGVTIRRTSQTLKLRTDASDRFQQVISPELTAYGLRAATDLIVKLAGGEVVGYVDEYPNPQEKRTVSVSLAKINTVLGTRLEEKDVADVLKRLDLQFKCSEMSSHCIFDVDVPFERLDITIPEDLIEEIGRITGYDKVPVVELPPFPRKPEVNPNFYAAEKVREDLISRGYSEVFMSVFADRGERAVLNKVGGLHVASYATQAGEHPFLRSTLIDGLAEALKKNIPNKDLLGLEEIKLFEIGTVWREGREEILIGTISEKEKAAEKPLEEYPKGGASCIQYDDPPLSATMRYQSFSKYPYIVRDIAIWVPNGTRPAEVLEIIKQNATDLLLRYELFDTFQKGGKTSLAFRLVFQSFSKTLTDEDVNQVMSKIYAVLTAQGFEIR
ncbi:MAG: phenylalanine--tRNA ligase subunit beta [Patescibacteria group bacterium]